MMIDCDEFKKKSLTRNALVVISGYGRKLGPVPCVDFVLTKFNVAGTFGRRRGTVMNNRPL